MNKKGWIVVLVIILLLGNLGPLAYADNNQPEARANQVTSPAITISWLQETHGIDENEALVSTRFIGRCLNIIM